MYGFIIRNEEGANIADRNSTFCYVLATGVARRLNIDSTVDYRGSNLRISNAIGVRTPFFNEMHIWTSTQWAHYSLKNIAGDVPDPGFGHISLGIDAASKYPEDSICFWQPGSNGLVRMTSTVFDKPFPTGWPTETEPWGVGRSFIAVAKHNVPLNWFVASDQPPGPPEGNYGIRLRRSDGTVAWDSRHAPATVEYMTIVPATTITGVLQNNTTADIVLPFDIPNAYVHCPSWEGYWRISDYYDVQTDVRLPMLKQVANNRFRISAELWPGVNNNTATDGGIKGTSAGSPGSQGLKAYAFDAPLFFSRGPIGFEP